MARSTLIIVAVVLALGGNHFSAQSFSVIQIHQLIAKVDRLERELATTSSECAALSMPIAKASDTTGKNGVVVA